MNRLAIVLLIAGCARPVVQPAPIEKPTLPPPPIVTSNVARGDYAGSKTCAACHSDEYDAWARSAMHNMTRLIATADVKAPFAGEKFVMKVDDAQMETHDGARFVTIHSQAQGTRVFRVTRVIGGHYREDFVGVEVERATKDSPALSRDKRPRGEERVLPISFMLGDRAYRYKGYSVMTPDRPGLRPGAPWAKTCIFCHNTEPYLDVMLGGLAPQGSTFQGELVDALLPEDRQRRFVASDVQGLRNALDVEMRAIGGTSLAGSDASTLALQAIRQLRGHFDGDKLLEVGIGCESCHGGSKEHVMHQATKPSYLPHAPYLATSPVVEDPSAARAQAINRTCARCHQVLFSGYPFAWEGSLRKDAVPGGSHINSGEGRDFLLGSCATRMACTDCHDPHSRDRAALSKVDHDGNSICLRCHEKFSAPEAMRAHSHHETVTCMGCHMPKKNMTLDNRLGRYHRIGSPNDPTRVERDRPLECALCHADKRVGELVDAMESWWGKRYDRAKLTTLYGELSANVMRATLARGKAHEQAIAIYSLAEANDHGAAPLIAAQLQHPYGILRYYAKNALTKLLGPAPSTVDVHALPAAIEDAAARWLATAKMKPMRLGDTIRAQPTNAEED